MRKRIIALLKKLYRKIVTKKTHSINTYEWIDSLELKEVTMGEHIKLLNNNNYYIYPSPDNIVGFLVDGDKVYKVKINN